MKAEILEAKGEAERFKEECTNLQDHVSASAGENLALSQKIQKLEAENKKLKEATKKEDKKKTDSAPKTNESQKGLKLGGNE